MKILKLLIINIIVLIILAAIFEFSLFCVFKKANPDVKLNLQKIEYYDAVKNLELRKPVGLNYKKRPIILMGCSYIYGLYLDGIHTPQYKLSELSKRPVYNFAYPGKGFQHSLFILQNKLFDTNIKNPEYVIFVMQYDFIRRMYSPVMFTDFVAYPVYEINNFGKVTLKSTYYPPYKKFFTYYYINNLIYFNFFDNDTRTHQRNVFAYFRAIRKEIEKTYPDIKFVILLYDDWNKFGFNFRRLERDGFIVIQTRELTGVRLQTPEYRVSDTDSHPTEKAWDIVIPALVKKLNL